MTVQEAISALKAYAEGYAGNIRGMCALAADLLESNVPRWISVEERLPEVDTGVLVAVRHMQTGQFYVRYDWRIKTTERCWWWKKTSESNVADLLAVTHWMPLPEPPKEKTP